MTEKTCRNGICQTSPWNDLKIDAAKVTLSGLRELPTRYDQLSALAGNQELLRNIPVVKRQQLSLEGFAGCLFRL